MVELRVPERARQSAVGRQPDLERAYGGRFLVGQLVRADAVFHVIANDVQGRADRFLDVLWIDGDAYVPGSGGEARRAEARVDAVGQAFQVSHPQAEPRRKGGLA